ELHTLGVNGGYSQSDVSELAKCLTGWRLRTKWRRGTVYFDPALHDSGSKTVLGQVIAPGTGEEELDAVIDIACNHPSTAPHRPPPRDHAHSSLCIGRAAAGTCRSGIGRVRGHQR